ncbi:MAG: hypothetical protein L0Z70_06125 [Chloroflexi bacterium]|nr:hypothetical protein [Chloroflexota bacterium]
MSAADIPYFLWDYDLSETDVQAILKGDDEAQKAWLVARILEAARYQDIWKYISLKELRAIFPQLQLKSQVRAAWSYALQVWTTEPIHER